MNLQTYFDQYHMTKLGVFITICGFQEIANIFSECKISRSLGGCWRAGLIYEELDIVEIFINNKWVTTHNLPVPASWMSSVFHDGGLYLMKGGRQNSTVFTRNCTSLISSSTKSSGTASTNKEIWRQFQAPGGWGSSVASYLSRLVIIDECERVGGYSVARLWVMATSIGPALDGVVITAATVLKTEKIVVAHHESLYKHFVLNACPDIIIGVASRDSGKG